MPPPNLGDEVNAVTLVPGKSTRARHPEYRYIHGAGSIHLPTIYARDGGVCGVCDEPVDYPAFHIDHIIPKSMMGPDSPDNLQIVHRVCNSRKGNRPGWKQRESAKDKTAG